MNRFFKGAMLINLAQRHAIGCTATGCDLPVPIDIGLDTRKLPGRACSKYSVFLFYFVLSMRNECYHGYVFHCHQLIVTLVTVLSPTVLPP